MKTIGDQVREFREARKWNAGQMAAAVDTSRQSIESLEASGNRIPKYIADLAHLMGVTVDDMLARAGLTKIQPAPIERWPFTRVALERFLALNQENRAFVEGRLASAIEECERAHAASPLLSLPGVSASNSRESPVRRKKQ